MQISTLATPQKNIFFSHFYIIRKHHPLKTAHSLEQTVKLLYFVPFIPFISNRYFAVALRIFLTVTPTTRRKKRP